MNNEARKALRQSLRDTRNQLTEEVQTSSAAALVDLITQQDFYKSAELIAFYHTIDGELNPEPLMAHALADGKTCFLPVINDDDPDLLSFAQIDSDTVLKENSWGISEPPVPDKAISPTSFDVVFVPLVGFDKNCFRLGMGKGFYDRTFSFKIFNRRSRPLLVGLAHNCQLTDPFPVASWDVRLDAVVTAEKIYRPDT